MTLFTSRSNKTKPRLRNIPFPPPNLPERKVFWDGHEIGETVVRHKTLNPVWFTEDGREHTTVVDNGSRKQTKTEQPNFWLEGSASVNPLLRVEVYDWDAVGSHDFLGGVELDLSDVVELQRNTLAKIRAHGSSSGQQVSSCRVVSWNGVTITLL